MAQKIKVTGGMDRRWVSTIRQSAAVSKVVKEVAEEIAEDADTMMQTLYPHSGYEYHYKVHTLKDRGYGETHIVVPTSNPARDQDNHDVLMSAAGRHAKKKGD